MERDEGGGDEGRMGLGEDGEVGYEPEREEYLLVYRSLR